MRHRFSHCFLEVSANPITQLLTDARSLRPRMAITPQIGVAQVVAGVRLPWPPGHFAGLQRRRLPGSVGEHVLQLRAVQANHDTGMMRMLRLPGMRGNPDFVGTAVGGLQRTPCNLAGGRSCPRFPRCPSVRNSVQHQFERRVWCWSTIRLLGAFVDHIPAMHGSVLRSAIGKLRLLDATVSHSGTPPRWRACAGDHRLLLAGRKRLLGHNDLLVSEYFCCRGETGIGRGRKQQARADPS